MWLAPEVGRAGIAAARVVQRGLDGAVTNTVEAELAGLGQGAEARWGKTPGEVDLDPQAPR